MCFIGKFFLNIQFPAVSVDFKLKSSHLSIESAKIVCYYNLRKRLLVKEVKYDYDT